MSSDIIIVDVAMPDLNGIEATRYIINQSAEHQGARPVNVFRQAVLFRSG